MTSRPHGQHRDPDGGSVSLYVVITFIALIVLAGLLLDGGRALAARGRAEAIAQQAARAGADALAGASLRSGGTNRLRLDPARARAAAQQILDTAGATGEITIDGTDVTVTAHTSEPTAILAIVDIQRMGGTATATAQAVPTTADGG